MSYENKYARRVFALLTLIVALLIGAFVLPRLLNSHVVAGENAAIAALINISEAENAYRERYPEIGFAPSIAALSAARAKNCEPSPEQACFIDYDLAHTEKPFRGYAFADAADSAQPHATYVVVAVPVERGRTGKRSFCVVEHGVPRYKDLARDANPHTIMREQCLRDFTPLP